MKIDRCKKSNEVGKQHLGSYKLAFEEEEMMASPRNAGVGLNRDQNFSTIQPLPDGMVFARLRSLENMKRNNELMQSHGVSEGLAQPSGQELNKRAQEIRA